MKGLYTVTVETSTEESEGVSAPMLARRGSTDFGLALAWVLRAVRPQREMAVAASMVDWLCELSDDPAMSNEERRLCGEFIEAARNYAEFWTKHDERRSVTD